MHSVVVWLVDSSTAIAGSIPSRDKSYVVRKQFFCLNLFGFSDVMFAANDVTLKCREAFKIKVLDKIFVS